MCINLNTIVIDNQMFCKYNYCYEDANFAEQAAKKRIDKWF